jgi:hypothetical protein
MRKDSLTFKLVEEYLIEKFDGDVQNRDTLQEVILIKGDEIVLKWTRPDDGTN